jgi:trk system potassium uptake protein
VIKGAARFLSFVVDEEGGKTVADLELPKNDSRVVCYYREGMFAIADEETKLLKGDEVVILTHSRRLAELLERWHPKQKGE